MLNSKEITTNFRFKSLLLRRTITQTIVGLAFFAYGVAPAAADATLSSDFVLQLNNSIFEAPQFALKNILVAEDLRVQLPDLVVQDLLPVSVSGIEFKLNYKFETAADYPLLGSEVAVASTEFGGMLNIAKLHVDGEVHQNHGGIEVIGHLNATCTDIQVELLPGKAKAVGSVLVQIDAAGKPTLTVPWFDVSWPEDAWVVRAVTCTGAEGFDYKLKEELIKYLKNSASFASQFKSFIDSTAADYQTLLRSTFAQPIEFSLGIPGVKSRLRADRIEALRGDRFQLRGVVDFAFESSTYNEDVKLTANSELKSQSGFTLALPNEFVGAFSDLSYRTGHQSMRRQGAEMTAFKSFREDSFAVSIAWPELGWYPKEMDFRFDFKTALKPKFGPLKSDGAGALIGGMTTNVKVDVWAQEFTSQMRYHKFGQFSSPVAAQYALSIGKDALGEPTLELAFSDLALTLAYAWDPTFTPRNPSVGVELIGDTLRKSLLATPTSFSIGHFNVHENLTLKPSAFRQTGPWLLLDFKK
jgi:hypothetical protein